MFFFMFYFIGDFHKFNLAGCRFWQAVKCHAWLIFLCIGLLHELFYISVHIQSTPHRIVIKINHASRLSNLTFEFEFGKKHHCEWSWIMSVCQHSCYSRDYITYSTIMCHCTNFVIEICLSRRLTCNVILLVFRMKDLTWS